MENIVHPTVKEIEILNLICSRFFNLYDEFISDSFWQLSAEIRFMKIKNCFEIYSELVKYKPIGYYIAYLKKTRPPQESFFAEEYFGFLRNILSHFPFFGAWDEIYVTKELVVWDNPKNNSILRFIKKHEGYETVKYRIWNNKTKKYTYMDINFPAIDSDRIFLKDLVSEKEGMLFCMVLMKRVLDSQIIQDNKMD